MRSGQLVDRPLPMLPLRAPDLILHAPRPRVHGGFPYSLFLENFGLLTLVAECPLMAISRPKRRSRHTSALPRIADIRGAMSAFAAITSASPPGADVPGSVAECRLMTQSRHSALLTNVVADDAAGEAGFRLPHLPRRRIDTAGAPVPLPGRFFLFFCDRRKKIRCDAHHCARGCVGLTEVVPLVWTGWRRS